MRIVGGRYRHRNIIYPDDATHTRPTKDRVREAIFSAVGDISMAVFSSDYTHYLHPFMLRLRFEKSISFNW